MTLIDKGSTYSVYNSPGFWGHVAGKKVTTLEPGYYHSGLDLSVRCHCCAQTFVIKGWALE